MKNRFGQFRKTVILVLILFTQLAFAQADPDPSGAGERVSGVPP